MLHRGNRIAVVLLLMLLGWLASPALAAQYRYGGGYRGYGEQGPYLWIEGFFANPRNTDSVVATFQTATATGPILPNWNDEFAGRFGLGYRWASGNRLSLMLWGFSADQSAGGDGPTGGQLLFAVGPPIPYGDGWLGTSGTPGSFDITTEIEAKTVDLLWSRDVEASERFLLGLDLGVRWAEYEETMQGAYRGVDGFDPGSGPLDAYKRNTGSMVGLRVAGRASYRFVTSWSLAGGLGFSMLDGEIEATSSLTPRGTVGGEPVLPNSVAITDDGRSGSIQEADVALVWHSRGDNLQVWIGWEQQTWDRITTDLVRNFPGTVAPLRDRDSVTISGYKLGLRYAF